MWRSRSPYVPPPPEGPGSWLRQEAKGQIQAIVLGDQWATIGEVGSQLPLSLLPQPGGLGNYNGQYAQHYSFARATGAGVLEFFGVDGELFNGNGYRIADKASDGCSECIPDHYPDALALPVPGRCGWYYIITARPGQGNEIQLISALLDMERPHAVESCGRGHLADLNEFGSGQPYEELADWFAAGSTGNDHLTKFGTIGTGPEEAATVGFAAVDPGWSNGTLILHVISDKYVHQYLVTQDGIQSSWVQEIEDDWVSIKEFTRDSDFGRDAQTGEILFATTDYGLHVEGELPSYGALVFRLNAATGALVDVNGYVSSFEHPYGSVADGTTGPYGCSFSPDGGTLYFTGDYQNLTLAAVDLASGQVIDLPGLPNLNIAQPGPWVRTRLTRAAWVDGTSEAIYYARSDGLAAIVNPNDPSTATWVADVPFSTPVNGLSLYTDPDAPSAPACRVMDALTAFDNHSDDLVLTATSACCAFMSDVNAECNYQFIGNNLNDPWLPGDNGFLDPDGDGVVLFASDYIVQPGSALALNGMTLRFAPDARLIIKPGALVRLTDCLLTGLICAESRWPGIRVEGTTNDAGQTNAAQGRLELYNTEVSNAVTGVWCARELQSGVGDPAGYGGIVNTWNNSRFRNCITGLRIGRYHRFLGGAEQNNRSGINQTQFITDAQRPDEAGPIQHAVLEDVNGVVFSMCAFRNEDHANMPFSARGVGIVANDARFRCFGLNYGSHHFQWLNAGIVMWNIDPLDASTIDGMAFDQNVYGVVDIAGHSARITHNRFRVLQNDVPTSQASVGLLLWGSELYTVERNTFENPPGLGNVPCIGVWFLGPTSQDNRIYNNTFTDLTFANAVTGRHASTVNGQGNVLDGLQILCNDFQDDFVDWFIYPNGYIKSVQAQGTGPANNRFFGTSTCNSDFEIYAFPRPPEYDNLYVDYNYFHQDGGFDPELRPECVEDEFGNAIVASTGQYFNLSEILSLNEFDPLEHCAGGFVEMPLLGNDALHELHIQKLAEYQSAVANFTGTVDLDEKTALLDAIDAQPAWPSYQLRDLLLGHSPLSDTVLLAAIHRNPAMDPWHLTQVLIANSELSMPVQKEVDYYSGLSSFFLGLLAQNAGNNNPRHVLEQEIRLRGNELAGLEGRLIHQWANDTVVPGRLDSLLAVFAEDANGSGLRMAYKTLLGQGHHTAAAAMEADVLNQRDGMLLAQFGAIRRSIGMDIHAATAAQRTDLEGLAFGEQGERSAPAWGALRAIGALDSLPVPLFPGTPRMAWLPGQSRNDRVGIGLGAYPDPASDRVNITYPLGTESGTLELFDAQGALLKRVSLNGTPAFKELDVRSLRPGLYLVRQLFEGMQVGEVKFTVVR